MAASRRLKVSVTATAQSFGDLSTTPGVKQDFIMQAASGSDDIFIDCNNQTCVADAGFVLEAGKDVSSKDLPEFFRMGPFSAVCNSGETGTLYVTFAKARG
jgi:hypothetical protein